VRGLSEDLYQGLWNLRKAYGARSWKDLLAKILREYERSIEEYEWL